MRPLADILYNFHWIVPGEAARAAQAWAGGLGPFLQARGIRAIVNLRGRNDDLSWWRQETAIAGARGIAHFDAMLDSRKLPTAEMLARLADVFDAAPRPFLVKCSGGQDRTSLAAAIFLLMRGSWGAMEAAQAQFARFPYLHFPKRHQRWLAAFPEFAAEDAAGLPLGEWIRTRYSPERFKAWLDARGQSDFYAAISRFPPAVLFNGDPLCLRWPEGQLRHLPLMALRAEGESGLRCRGKSLSRRAYFSGRRNFRRPRKRRCWTLCSRR